MVRDYQKHVSRSGLHFDQDPKEERKWRRFWEDMELNPSEESSWMEGLRMTLVYQVFIMVLVQGA